MCFFDILRHCVLFNIQIPFVSRQNTDKDQLLSLRYYFKTGGLINADISFKYLVTFYQTVRCHNREHHIRSSNIVEICIYFLITTGITF